MNRGKLVKVGGVALFAWLAVCSDAYGPDYPRLPVTPETSALQLAISEPVASFHNVSTNGGSNGGTAYVAFATGEQPDWHSISLGNRSSGIKDPRRYAFVDGALDPVAIAAAVGDTLQIDVIRLDGTSVSLKAGVPSRRAPRVIRTSPALGRTEVTLNVRILVVFSEPVEAATITPATVRLLMGNEPVVGTFVLTGNSTLLVEFVPAEPLLPNTSYVLVVNRGVQDVSGESLQESTGVPFQTGASVGPQPVATVKIMAGDTWLDVGSAAQFVALVRDAAWNAVASEIIWSTSDATVATVSPSGRVYAGRVGTAAITASSGGRLSQVVVTVTDPAAGVGSVTGVVLDALTQLPLAPTDFLRIQASPNFILQVGAPSIGGLYNRSNGFFSIELPAGQRTIHFSAVFAGTVDYPGLRTYADTSLTVDVVAGMTTVVPDLLLRPRDPLLLIAINPCSWALPDPPTQYEFHVCDATGDYRGFPDVQIEVNGVAGTGTAGVHYEAAIRPSVGNPYWEAWEDNIFTAHFDTVAPGDYDVSVVRVGPDPWQLVPWQAATTRVTVAQGLSYVRLDFWHK